MLAGSPCTRLPTRPRARCPRSEIWLRSDIQLRCRVLPVALESFEHCGAHRGGGVGVGGAHAGRVVAEPFVLQDLWNTELGKQGLVTVTQIVKAQPRAPRRDGGGQYAPVACEALGGAVTVHGPLRRPPEHDGGRRPYPTALRSDGPLREPGS